MTIDPYILAFSAVTVIVTVWMGFRSAKTSKTASDFFVAGRSVSVGWNASAISGEYLSAASFMGVAGMVMSSGYDALWYPVCYACGYLFLLLFIAGPLRRFGAYTIPDFAEGRFDSPVFRKIAVVFVLFIGFFYTMPQMKGAGTTLAYIFKDIEFFGAKGLPYWVGVVLVGAVITLNVALGGMKGITLVQAFQYWIKMFAISVPIFVLMSVYGHYGKQVGVNGGKQSNNSASRPLDFVSVQFSIPLDQKIRTAVDQAINPGAKKMTAFIPARSEVNTNEVSLHGLLHQYSWVTKQEILMAAELASRSIASSPGTAGPVDSPDFPTRIRKALENAGLTLIPVTEDQIAVVPNERVAEYRQFIERGFLQRQPLPAKAPKDETWLNPFGPLTTKAAKAAAASIGKQAEKSSREVGEGSEGREVKQPSSPSSPTSPPSQPSREIPSAGAAAEKAWLAKHEKPLALLYTYSLIIALVCGTAGLPHILVRFYTNPDGVAAKRTTMWVMILIGVFYVFPPIFGVMGRNLLPELYNGVGAKGTDKVVLELPRILNSKAERDVPRRGEGSEGQTKPAPSLPPSQPSPPSRDNSSGLPWGSILSGITCAGAFAAFMSTFSGLLVSMTGALAHDVFGRMLRPKATAEQRMRMFKWCAVIVGGVAVALGSQVEKLEINFMVGQAFAIAAASYFPLLFMSVWWRKLTMKGAATGMLSGGLLALGGISLTSFTTLGWLKWDAFWAAHPLLRILCEQPAIWAVPLAITLMVVISKLTAKDVPPDIRMKMLVLHAPEKLGLKQEYIQENQAGH